MVLKRYRTLSNLALPTWIDLLRVSNSGWGCWCDVCLGGWL